MYYLVLTITKVDFRLIITSFELTKIVVLTGSITIIIIIVIAAIVISFNLLTVHLLA